MATLNQINFNEFDILKDSTLLYVEDDEAIRNETLAIFERFFKKIHTAEDGEEALEKFRLYENDIDLILTDISMPKMDGIDFMREVRKENNNVPIFIITALSESTYILKSIKYKISDYIMKPMQVNTTLKIFSKNLKDNLNAKLVNKQQRELRTYKDILDKENLVSETDLKGNITYANDIFCEISGYSRDELIGKPHNIVRHPDVSSKIYEKLWETIKSGNAWTGKLKNINKNGDSYYVKSTIFPIFDNEGQIEKYVATRFLITEDETEKHKLKKHIMQQKVEQIKNEKRYQEEFDDALHLAKMQKDEQVAKFLHELNEQIKSLRKKNSDDKGRINFLEKKLKEALDRNDELQISYQKRIEKLHKTAVVAIEQYKNQKKTNTSLLEKIEKSHEGIKSLQNYIDEYRAKIKDLEDVIAAYEKEHGTFESRKRERS